MNDSVARPMSLLLLLVLTVVTCCSSCSPAQETAVAPPENKKIRVLIVDGQNNHPVWPRTTEIMKSMLTETGLFRVSVARTEPKGEDPDFAPVFSDYDVVISNYNGSDWPEATRESFEQFVSAGGGFVVVHAADNAFASWPAYNRMIGLGGWGNRNEAAGPWYYYDHGGNPVRDPGPGNGGSHGQQHEFVVETRLPEHPVMRGMPAKWLHTQDELYDRLRGPAEEIEILATSFADPAQGGSGRHEPMVMAVQFGSGRVFHTTLGHAEYSMECAGFATLLQRGTEWAATGEVTQPLPETLPSENATVKWSPRPELKKIELGTTVNPFEFGNIILAGQPGRDDLALLKERGIKKIVSLRRESEDRWDQSEWATSAGFEFQRFPVGGAKDMTDEWFASVRQQLSAADDENRLLLHCGAAVRVGAAWAAWRVLDSQIPLEQAMEEATQMGLKQTAMVQRTREYIQSRQTAK